MFRARLSRGIARSIGIAWNPSPAPPGGTIWEISFNGSSAI